MRPLSALDKTCIECGLRRATHLMVSRRANNRAIRSVCRPCSEKADRGEWDVIDFEKALLETRQLPDHPERLPGM